jgi:uncharacterized alpha-E superfamily protein
MWEQLNRLYLDVIERRPEKGWILRSHDFFQSVLEGAYLFHGITDATMSHGEGRQFIHLGRYVERANTLTTLLETHFHRVTNSSESPVEGAEYLEWVGLLGSCVAVEAYCKAHTAEIRPLRLAEFLLLNPEFPHSIRFAVDHVNAALNLIADSTRRSSKLPTRIAGRLRAQLSFSQIEEIMTEGIHSYLQIIREECDTIHSAIHDIYFDYSIEAELAS